MLKTESDFPLEWIQACHIFHNLEMVNTKKNLWKLPFLKSGPNQTIINLRKVLQNVKRENRKSIFIPTYVHIGSVALLSHYTLKGSAILGLSFFAWCWWPRESMLWGSSMLSEFHTSLSKVLTLWHCVKVKQCYHSSSRYGTNMHTLWNISYIIYYLSLEHQQKCICFLIVTTRVGQGEILGQLCTY